MKGQKLFVRPMEADDASRVREFLDRESPESNSPAAALIGKLVGELVAVLSIEIGDERIGIVDLVVARELRKKRIGRVMIDELQALAAKIDRKELVMMCDGPAGFLQRVGFEAGDGGMVRRALR